MSLTTIPSRDGNHSHMDQTVPSASTTTSTTTTTPMHPLSTNGATATVEANISPLFHVMDIDPNSPAPPANLRLASTSMPPDSVNASSSSSSSLVPRHMTLWDMISLGVGGTVGSGIFVLTGHIARDYAGPATVVSWALAGMAAATSALSLCELASRIPDVGSTYAYCRTCKLGGRSVAIIAAACLTLEYAGSGAAVARTWGDKVVWWLSMLLLQASKDDNHHGGSGSGELNDHVFLETSVNNTMHHYHPVVAAWLLPLGGWINVPALFISAASTLLLLLGVKESKCVTNFFTALKMMLVTIMIIGGFVLLSPANLGFSSAIATSRFMPYGIAGVLRGTTSAFFGYIGYDEICVVAGEALHPSRDVPRAILWTLAIVTVCYVCAAVALTGMLPYTEISRSAGFPAAFEARDWNALSQLSAVGEIVTLPIVVLISLLAQPRLTLSMAQDGLVPASLFARQNAQGNLIGGTLIWGIAMTLTATFVPFKYLDDLISCGILVAFCLANSCLLVLRRRSLLLQQLQQQEQLQQPSSKPKGRRFSHYNQQDHEEEEGKFFRCCLLAFNALCGCTCLVLRSYDTVHTTTPNSTSSSSFGSNRSHPSTVSTSHYDEALEQKQNVPDTDHVVPWIVIVGATLLTLATVACYAYGIAPHFHTDMTHPNQHHSNKRRRRTNAKSSSLCASFLWSSSFLQSPNRRSNCWYETVDPNGDDDSDDSEESKNHHHSHDHSHGKAYQGGAGSSEAVQDTTTTISHDNDVVVGPATAAAATCPPPPSEHGHFVTPCVSLLPCLGMAINWYLIAQLEVEGLILLLLYLGGTVALYRVFGSNNPRPPPPGAMTIPTSSPTPSYAHGPPLYDMTHHNPPAQHMMMMIPTPRHHLPLSTQGDGAPPYESIGGQEEEDDDDEDQHFEDQLHRRPSHQYQHQISLPNCG